MSFTNLIISAKFAAGRPSASIHFFTSHLFRQSCRRRHLLLVRPLGLGQLLARHSRGRWSTGSPHLGRVRKVRSHPLLLLRPHTQRSPLRKSGPRVDQLRLQLQRPLMFALRAALCVSYPLAYPTLRIVSWAGLRPLHSYAYQAGRLPAADIRPLVRSRGWHPGCVFLLRARR